MSHLHERSAEELEGVGMSHMLDCVPFDLHQKMVDKPRCDRFSAQCARRGGTSETVAMPGLQSTERRPTEELHLLVRKGRRSQIVNRHSTPFLWPDVRQGESEKMSSPLSAYLPCWAMSALHTYRTDPDLLLWQARSDEKMLGHRLRFRLELWRSLRRDHAMW
jgi:hypothetical protein